MNTIQKAVQVQKVKIISSKTPEELEEKLSEFLSKGWRLHGVMTVDKGLLIQPLKITTWEPVEATDTQIVHS